MTCAYHGGVSGHSIKHCMTLKHKVQSLIDVGWLRFEEENRSLVLMSSSNILYCHTKLEGNLNLIQISLEFEIEFVEPKFH